jgi:hypothetical protein
MTKPWAVTEGDNLDTLIGLPNCEVSVVRRTRPLEWASTVGLVGLVAGVAVDSFLSFGAYLLGTRTENVAVADMYRKYEIAAYDHVMYGEPIPTIATDRAGERALRRAKMLHKWVCVLRCEVVITSDTKANRLLARRVLLEQFKKHDVRLAHRQSLMHSVLQVLFNRDYAQIQGKRDEVAFKLLNAAHRETPGWECDQD